MWQCAVLYTGRFEKPLVLACSIVHGSLYYFQVLDEADRMLDMGFEPQIREIVSRIRVSPNILTAIYVTGFKTSIRLQKPFMAVRNDICT